MNSRQRYDTARVEPDGNVVVGDPSDFAQLCLNPRAPHGLHCRTRHLRPLESTATGAGEQNVKIAHPPQPSHSRHPLRLRGLNRSQSTPCLAARREGHTPYRVINSLISPDDRSLRTSNPQNETSVALSSTTRLTTSAITPPSLTWTKSGEDADTLLRISCPILR